jgi:hypothetical protein
MAIDTLAIGPVPVNERCEQLGPNYDSMKARQECHRFIDAIRGTVGPEPAGAKLIVTRNEHDFGVYYEVAVRFDDDNHSAAEYAYRVESHVPLNWPRR